MRGDLEIAFFERNFGGYSDETQAVLLEARQGMTPFEIASKRQSMKASARHERILFALNSLSQRTPWRVLREAAVIPERFSIVDKDLLMKDVQIIEGTYRADLYRADLDEHIAREDRFARSARAILEISGPLLPVDGQYIQTYAVSEHGKRVLTQTN